MNRFSIFISLALFLLMSAQAATNQTAAWDLHPQAAELTEIKLQWWTSIDPTKVAQSVAGDQTTATQAVNGNIGDTVFVRARACKDTVCSAWTADATGVIAPSGILRLRITFDGTLTVQPIP